MPLSPFSVAAALAAPLVGAFFAAADAALTSLSNARIAAMLEQPDVAHPAALRHYAQNQYFVSATCVVGRVIFTALTAVLVADMADTLLAPSRLDTLLAIPLTVILVAPLFDAAVSLAERRAATWAGRLGTYLRPFEILFWPLAQPLAALSKWLVKRFDGDPDPEDEKILLSAEVEALVDEVEKSGAVGAEPAEMIRNVLEFEDLRATDVMIPRSRIEAIDSAMSLDKVRQLVADSGHSRYPVYEGQLDNVIGLLCAKDVFKLGEGKKQRLADVTRKDVIFVHELQSLASLLREMRGKRQHMAVVVDEFGATSGLITLEDVIERIVGDIRDEHDDVEAAPIQDLGNGRLVANATVSMGDLSAYLGTSIPEEARRESLASVLKEEEEPIEVGRTIEKWGLVFIVRDMTGKRVERLEVVRPDAA
jgi:putative hemolysin